MNSHSCSANSIATELGDSIDLEALVARCLGNHNLVKRVLTKFIAQVDADLELFELAVGLGNCEQAALVAHRIKGIAGSVAAKQLFEDAALAEQHALDSHLRELPKCLRQMKTDRMRLEESLSSALRQISGANTGSR